MRNLCVDCKGFLYLNAYLFKKKYIFLKGRVGEAYLMCWVTLQMSAQLELGQVHVSDGYIPRVYLCPKGLLALQALASPAMSQC